MTARWIALALVVLAGVPAMAQAPGPEIRISSNVFLVPDPYAKTVTGTVVIRAGCADEPGGCDGIAHYLEHLLFINRDGEHRSKVALFPSGNGNGWTSHRATGYFQTFPVKPETLPADIEKLVSHLAGLMREVLSDETQAARERNVVLQEHQQRTGSNVFARFSLKRNALLIPGDPLGQSIGGTPQSIPNFTTERAIAFHKTWYSAANANFIFTGPISAADLEAQVKRHLDTLDRRDVPKRPWLQGAAIEPGRHVIDEADPEARQVAVYYDKIITYPAPDTAERQLIRSSAHSVINSFLSSRLTGSPTDLLIEKEELVSQGGFGIGELRPGMMRISFSGTPANGVMPEAVAEAAKRYVDALSAELIPQAYLDRLRRRDAIGNDIMRQEPSRYAQSLTGWLSGEHDYEAWARRQQIAESLTLSDVHAALAPLSGPGREVIAILRPAATR